MARNAASASTSGRSDSGRTLTPGPASATGAAAGGAGRAFGATEGGAADARLWDSGGSASFCSGGGSPAARRAASRSLISRREVAAVLMRAMTRAMPSTSRGASMFSLRKASGSLVGANCSERTGTRRLSGSVSRAISESPADWIDASVQATITASNCRSRALRSGRGVSGSPSNETKWPRPISAAPRSRARFPSFGT